MATQKVFPFGKGWLYCEFFPGNISGCTVSISMVESWYIDT